MDQSSANQLTGLGFGFFALIAIFALAGCVFSIWMWWRILEKAGFSGALSLLLLTGIGGLILQIMLAFSRWPMEDKIDALRARQSTALIEHP
jgi:preprotein translocase subunit SecY